MSTSYFDEQKLRLETLHNDLAVRRNTVPPSELHISRSQRASGGSMSAPSFSSSGGVERVEPPSLSDKG
jgi:hypothetical protein